MDGFFSKIFFFPLAPARVEEVVSVRRGWNRVEEQITGRLCLVRESGGRLGGLRRWRRPAGAWAPAPYPHPHPLPHPHPELGLAPWRASARCRGAGVGGTNPAGSGKEAEGGCPRPTHTERLAPTGPHPQSAAPRNMSAAGAQSRAPERRTGGGRVQWRRRRQRSR